MACFLYSRLLLGNDDLKSWNNPTFQGISEGEKEEAEASG